MDDSRDNLITILKDKYDYELNRKKTLDDALTLPVTLLSFIVGSIYLLVTDISDKTLSSLELFCKWLLFSLLLLSALIAFVCLYKVYFGFRRFYCTFPASSEVLTAYDTLTERHSSVQDGQLKEQYIISDLKEYNVIWYKDCNLANTGANDRRADAFFAARMWLGISMIICILLLIFICIVKTHDVKQTSNSTATSASCSSGKE